MRANKIFRAVIVMGACVTTSLWACRPAWTAEPVPTDRLLPPEVHAFVTVPNVQQLKERFGQTRLGRLGEEPALNDFLKDVSAQWDQWSEQVQKEIGVPLNDLVSIPAGEASVAVVQPSGQSMQIVGFLDFGDRRQTVDKLLDKAADALAKQGVQRSVKNFEGTEITIYSRPQQNGDVQDSQQPRDKQLAYFIRDSRLVIGTDPAVLEGVLARWDGKHPKTFADDELYSYIVQRAKTRNSQAAANWFFNPVNLVKGAANSPGSPPNVQTQMVLGFLPTLGLTQVKAVGGSIDLATKEHDYLSRTVVYVDQPTQGLLNAFRFPAVAQSPPDWVSADASMYYALNWDIAGAWNAVETLVDTFQGPGTFAKLIDDLANSPDGPQIHLKKDIIDQLTGAIHLISEPPSADQVNRPRFLAALEVKDEGKMKSVLASVAKAPGFPGKTREFRGQTLYEISGPAAGGGALTAGLSVVRGHLMIATDVSMLERIIRSDPDQPSLAKSAEYRRIARQFPAKTSILGFQRQSAQMKAAYELVRSGQTGNPIPGIDFTKLPPFEAIEKYLAAAGSYVVPDERGVLFVSFTPRE